MYYRVDRTPGVVRVVESHKDELTEAGFFGAVGLLALNYVVQNLETIATAEGFSRSLLIGIAFTGVFMLSTSFSSGIGRLARGRGRGRVIEIDLARQRYRRYQNNWFIRKIGGEWQALPEPVQGARVVWKGERTQTALRLGQGRSFFFATEPGEIGNDLDGRLAEAVNRSLSARGVVSQETAAPAETRHRTLRSRFRDAWEYLSVLLMGIVFMAFLYSLYVVTIILDLAERA